MMNFGRHILLGLCLAGAYVTAGAQISFSGSSRQVIEIEPSSSTGLEKVYVVDDVSGVKMSYTSTSGNTVVWKRFSSMGGGYAEPVDGVTVQGNVWSVPCQPTDMGYIVEDSGRQRCFWVVNYAMHTLDLETLAVSPDSDCDRTFLVVSGSGDKIKYYSVNGQPIELSRGIDVTYRTLVYNTEDKAYHEQQAEETIADIEGVISVAAPLCNTEFTMSGDRFLRTWGMEQSVESAPYSTVAVAAETYAEQTSEEYDNEQNSDTQDLGGSAPAEITFTAAVSDAVVFKEWQFSKYEEFDDILDRYNSETVTRVFDENGTLYVRFVAGNTDGSCLYYGDTYTVSIGESALQCPNAFSPANQDGVNDLWKVSYKSIVSFECNIFNRWGKKLATLTHPSQGWDGKTGGKFVPSGVYFYVIKARGADGKEYNLSGDINIINTRKNPNSGTSTTE